ncbi:MAG TPA: hypothetical protein VHT53_13970 [Candidatus Elarobacter sp.]|jgi:hypothetical protein|nr:hypothetical protein [Candidatus Elarobacter sp.]
MRRIEAFLAAAAFVAGLTVSAAAQTTLAPVAPRTMSPMPGVALALDAGSLRAQRTRGGYRLTGRALVRDACTDARFRRTAGVFFPPRFDAVQYRRPGTQNVLCIAHLMQVAIAPLTVTSGAPPRTVSVRTAKGVVRVPVTR